MTQILTLAGLTKRGRQVVRRHGDRWECLRVAMRVRFSDLAGPWYYLAPLGERRVDVTVRDAREDSAARWVHAWDDDFKVMP